MKKVLLFFISIFLLYQNFIFSQPTQGLIGYWPFSGDARDYSGFSNNGTTYNVQLTNDRFGNPSKSYFFNGANSYINFGNAIPQVTNQLTISVWVKTDNPNISTKEGRIIVSKYGWNTLNKGFGLSMNDKIFFWGKDQTYEYNSISSGTRNMYDNNWHHLVGVVNNTTWEFWIDKIKVGSISLSHSTVNLSQSYNLYVGNLFNGGTDVNIYFKGAIDDLRIYNRAVTPSEINELYYEGNYPNTLHTISVISNPIGGGTVIGGGAYSSGSTVTLTAIPSYGYKLLYWSEDNNIIPISDNELSVLVNSSKTYTAHFFLKEYQVITSSSPVYGGRTAGTGNYVHGSNVTVNCTPYNDFVFNYWTNKNGSVVATTSEYKFTATQDIELIAHFSPKPQVPSPPFAKSAMSITQTSFIANWNKVNGATNYFLDVSLDKDFYNILSSYENKSVGDVSSALVTGLVPSTTYFYRVRSTNVSGISSNSNVIETKTLAYPPGAPTITAATSLTETGFNANWNEVVGALGYFIDVAHDENFTNKLSRYNNKDVGDVNTYEITNLVTNLTYYYRVRAYNSGGTSSHSSTVAVMIITGVEEITELPEGFALNQNYPNPFNPITKISYSIPSSTFVRMVVYDGNGSEIAVLVNEQKPAGTHQVIFNAEKFPSGVYIYSLQAGMYNIVKKMTLVK